jgi:hypothetical protein
MMIDGHRGVRRPPLALAVACSAALLAGCYRYGPLPAAVPAAGSRVSVQLSDEGSRALARQVGAGVARIEGSVLEADSNGLAIAVRRVETSRGERMDWNGESVQLPRRSVQAIHQRRLSLGATGALGGAVVAGVLAASQLIGGGGVLEGAGGAGGTTSPK